jgi:hypothetical protein
VGSEEVVNEAVDFGHLMLYAGHGPSSSGCRSGVATSFYMPASG